MDHPQERRRETESLLQKSRGLDKGAVTSGLTAGETHSSSARETGRRASADETGAANDEREAHE